MEKEVRTGRVKIVIFGGLFLQTVVILLSGWLISLNLTPILAGEGDILHGFFVGWGAVLMFITIRDMLKSVPQARDLLDLLKIRDLMVARQVPEALFRLEKYKKTHPDEVDEKGEFKLERLERKEKKMGKNKFEKGKWYKYTGNKGNSLTWSPDMYAVLDHKPRLCTDDEKEDWQTPHEKNAFAAFDGGDVKDWCSVQDNFVECEPDQK